LIVTILDAGGSDVEGFGDSQNRDKLGNFPIQGLLSDFNVEQATVGSVLKSKADAIRTDIGKI
jgi:hypothetical protein